MQHLCKIAETDGGARTADIYRLTLPYSSAFIEGLQGGNHNGSLYGPALAIPLPI